jgi:DnaJ-domain-containing protein 1
MKRVEYILERHGLPLSETDQLEDPAFIMEIMESREELEEASSQEDVNALIAANQGWSRLFQLGSFTTNKNVQQRKSRRHYRS